MIDEKELVMWFYSPLTYPTVLSIMVNSSGVILLWRARRNPSHLECMYFSSSVFNPLMEGHLTDIVWQEM